MLPAVSSGRRRFALVAAVIVIGGAVFGVVKWRQAIAEADELRRRQEREAREVEREDEMMQAITRLQEESRGLMPELVRPVALGMTRREVQGHRRRATPSLQARDATLDWLEERFPNGAQALYGFSKRAN